MRSRSRVALALLIALALHVVAREVVDGASVRAIARGPAATRVAVELMPRPAPAREDRVVAAPETRAPEERHPERAPAEGAERAPAESASPERAPAESAPAESAPVESAPVESAPVDSAPVESAPVVPSMRAEKPRSFLERAIAGTNGGPAPGLDTLDPSAGRAPVPESDGAKVKRSVDELVRSSAARGAPRTEAGPVQLVELGDGTYRYKTGGFVATIGRDGSVAFVNLGDKAGLGASALGHDLSEPYGAGMQSPAGIDGDRREVGNEPVMGHAATLGAASFDPSAALMRAQGQDPYEHEKLCFLDDTRDLRADLRKAHERAQMGGLRRALESAWFDDAPAPERRAALFAIWDECREEEVGLVARELVVSFVKQHLPRGSVDAFTAAELEALNARRASTSAFEPYSG